MPSSDRPLRRQDVVAIFDRKMADFHHKGRRLVLHHVELEAFVEAARHDPDVRLALDTGFIEDLQSELRDPVLVRLEEQLLLTCPPLALRVLRDEPPQIHLAFLEGAFLRKLFRFFVPAAHEGGEAWEVNQQVREIMQRHFPFQLVACETVLAKAS